MHSLRPFRQSARQLCCFLVLLLLANSTQALEIITHEGHGHGSAAPVSAEQTVDGGSMDHAKDAMSHGGSGNHGSHRVAAHSLHDAPDHQSSSAHAETGSSAATQAEDCVCDEICCVSSVGFGSLSGTTPKQDLASPYQRLTEHYLSVSLDLTLEPPTL